MKKKKKGCKSFVSKTNLTPVLQWLVTFIWCVYLCLEHPEPAVHLYVFANIASIQIQNFWANVLSYELPVIVTLSSQFQPRSSLYAASVNFL